MNPECMLDDLSVVDVRHLLIENPATVRPEQTPRDLLETILACPRTRIVYVIDDEHRLIGSVRLNQIVDYLFPFTAIEDRNTEFKVGFPAMDKIIIRDMMNQSPRAVTENTSLSDMARILIREKITELPVVDADRHLLGQIKMYEVIEAYLKRKPESDKPATGQTEALQFNPPPTANAKCSCCHT